MNSTIAETHQQQHGYLGEEQLRWFDRELAGYQAQGWLRVGVLHHNPVRGAGDDAYLYDMDQLGPDGIPVLCAGSSGVVAGRRPPEVPNQYQLIEVRQDGLQVTARSYDPADLRWIGDTRISEHGDRPYRYLRLGCATPSPATPDRCWR